MLGEESIAIFKFGYSLAIVFSLIVSYSFSVVFGNEFTQKKKQGKIDKNPYENVFFHPKQE